MDLVKLLDEDYEAIEAADCPPNLSEHMVRYVQKEYFAKGQQPNAAFISELLKQTTHMLRVLPNVIEVNRSKLEDNSGMKGRVTVIGDLHGQYRDLEYLLSEEGPIGFPSPDNQIVVNGDMVDRGDMSVEIILILSIITVLAPGSVHMLRGNHEATPKLADAYGFHLELRQKFDHAPEVTVRFVQLLDVLPVAAVIDDAIFVVHGGIGHFTHTMRPIQLNRGNRFTPCITGTPLYELLWNDPQTIVNAAVPAKRGETFSFTHTSLFLAKNNYKLLIRSHQYCDTGICKAHDNLCYTVFSAANYSGKHTNTGAVVVFDDLGSTEPNVVQFEGRHYPTDGAACVFGKKFAELSAQKGELKGYHEQLDYELQLALELSRL